MGKTRTGAEDAAWFRMRNPESRIAIVAPTAADARDTIEGESGLRSIIPGEMLHAWNRSLGELIPTNGTRQGILGRGTRAVARPAASQGLVR